uniref:Potassium channel domain-containing protein n=1 Tax=Caenorhabditis japonica TaxID=281687 RepID=A0A8R1HZS5_CAEJA
MLLRLDAKRSDLLNVLWAETITNGEDDWSELADQKLELYEKALLQHYGIDLDNLDRSFASGLQKSFSISSTIGPLDVDDFTTIGKFIAVIYALIGAPLFWTVIGQLRKMVTSLWQGTTLWIVTIIYVFVAAIIYDIVEGGSDDVPFIEAIFSIFLQFTTVGEVDNEFHGVLPYCVVVLGLALMTALYHEMKHNIEHFIHPFEYSFNRMCGGVERWIEEKNDDKKVFVSSRIEEENEDELSDYEDSNELER